MNTKTIIIGFLSILFNTFLFSQENTAHQWYFGENAGVDFSSGIPVVRMDGQIDSWEGCATVGDMDGNLLFYTDGQNVYNRNHDVMQNGSGLMGSWSATQSSIIVKFPDSESLFYIFTVDAVENHLENGLRYSMVDMSLDGGLGGVTDVKNVLLETPVVEKLTSIMHADNKSVWVVTHKWNSNEFSAYKITNTGIINTPIISEIGIVHEGGYSPGIYDGWINALGYMKANMDGTKIALVIARADLVELFDFNRTTGVLSNCMTSDNDYLAVVGVEFSPSSDFLYISRLRYNGEEAEILQFDLTQSNPLENSTVVYTGSNNSGIGYLHGLGALQLAPNGKIYVMDAYSLYLSAINNPNNEGAACDYEEQAVYLGGRYGVTGLPTIFYYKGFEFFNGSEVNISICENDSIFLGNAYQTTEGTYYDTVQSYLGWDSIVNTHLSINSSPTIYYNENELSSSFAPNYQWYHNSTLIEFATEQNFIPSLYGSYQVAVEYSNDCICFSNELVVTNSDLIPIENKINIFPNPTSNIINISGAKSFTITVINIHGQIVIREINVSQDKSTIDLSNLNNGVYFLRIITTDTCIVKRILKQ